MNHARRRSLVGSLVGSLIGSHVAHLGITRLLVLAAVFLFATGLLVWPSVALLSTLFVAPVQIEIERLPQLASGSDIPPATMVRLFAWSVGYALGASILGALLAWPAALAIARRIDLCSFQSSKGESRKLVVIIALALLPLALPPWLLSSAVWLSVGPGTPLGDLAEQHDAMGVLRLTSLATALVAWSSALVFAALIFARPSGMARSALLQQIDRFGTLSQFRAALARDGARLGWGVAASTIFLMSETTVFDLAQVQSFGFELRVRDALGATHAEVLQTALPLVLMTVVPVAFLPRTLTALGAARARMRRMQPESSSLFARTSLWPSALACILPMTACVFLLRALGAVPRTRDFLTLHGEALATTLLIAGIAALIAGAFAVTLRLAMDAPLRGVRVLVRAVLLIALVIAILPSTLAAGALESAYNHDATAFVYDTPLVVVLVLAVRAMAVGSMVVLIQDAVEDPSAARLRSLDGASFAALWRGFRVEARTTLLTVLPLAFAWSLGELTASGRLVPPGMAWLATDILNAIHYQRAETVLLGTGVFLAVGAIGAVVTALALIRHADSSRSANFGRALLGVVWLSISCLVVACDEANVGVVGAGNDTSGATNFADGVDPPGFDKDAPRVDRALPVEFALAGVGRGPGQFNGPRVVACDLATNEIYVIDKDARVQRFDASGNLLKQWRMPKTARGKPVGATVAPDGTLVILDTHEHRVVGYSPNGEELWTLGSYGREHGQFIYPTDAAFAPDGRLFIAEYGGNDRIQVFSRDRAFLYAFGACGIGEREFLRPQSLAYDAERDELYVADTGNHRVAVFTSDGEFRRALGGAGREEGKLSYPFGVVLEIGGLPSVVANGLVRPHDPSTAVSHGSGRRTVIVAENSNHRVQRLDAETGEVIAVAGGLGRGEGRLKYPWAVESAWPGSDGVWRVAVCDHGNSRIVFFALPDRASVPAAARESGKPL